ncbi:hypothetical protein ACFGVR_13170 [Mucilaginibacter sp. AW1-3]
MKENLRPKTWIRPQMFVIDRANILSGQHNQFHESTIHSIGNHTSNGNTTWYFKTQANNNHTLNGAISPSAYFS